MGIVSYEGADFEPERTDLSTLPYDCQNLWLVIQDDTAPMEKRDDAVGQLQAVAERGDAHTQYLMGKLYRDGPVLIPDSVEAR